MSINTANLQQLSGSPGCVICDNNNSNPRSLHVTIFWDEESGSIHIPFEPDVTCCGYAQVVHGGVVASVLDEAMAWVVKQHTGEWALTAEFTIRLKQSVSPGTRYLAIAEVAERKRRVIRTQARLLDPHGQVVAAASATFLPALGRAAPKHPVL